MTLLPGTRLGPYEITGFLGAGGMGEVYRAADTNLGRQVAMKVLPAAVALDAERLARFDREARTLAALNHPNIAQIYGIERSNAVTALVMELVEGQDLSAVIGSGTPRGGGAARKLNLDDALAIARQIVDALEAAHDQGIVHRDLKPANVKVRPDGTVKVLDFGLAKVLEPPAALGGPIRDAANSPTITSPAMTALGMILGTAAYMAPEQARGRPADRRADIWAFGCVLYEMLTGQRAFPGDDATDTLAAVVRAEPDWSALPSDVPPTIASYLRRCLHKDPRQRLQAVGDMRLALDGAFDVPVAQRSASSPTPRPVWRRAWPAAGALAIGALLGGIAVREVLRPDPPAVVRLMVGYPTPGTPVGPLDPDVTMAPDGRRIAYIVFPVEGATGGDLYVHDLDQLEPRRLTGNARSPFFSPDGAWVGFVDDQDRSLQRVAVTGGTAVRIASLRAAGNGNPRGASWAADGTIVFAVAEGGLWRVPARGGEPTQLTRPDAERGERMHFFPEVLPDGRTVLFAVVGSGPPDRSSQVAVLDLATSTHTTLVRGSNPRYVRSGHIVFALDGVAYAVGFDAASRTLTGAPFPVIDRVTTKNTGAGNFSLSAEGTLVYTRGVADILQHQTVAWVDRNGTREPVGAPERDYVSARLSPDGSRVALDVRGDAPDIWIWDLVRRTFMRLTSDPEPNRGVAWHPDGLRLAFSAVHDGGEHLYWQAPDGSSAAERLPTDGGALPLSFSPDGTRLFFSSGSTPSSVNVLHVERGNTEVLFEGRFNYQNPMLSPDGHWLAYQSNESGSPEIYVRRFPDVHAGGRWQVSTSGGRWPLWAPNGRELFFVETAPLGVSGRMMAVPFTTGTTFTAGIPRALFEVRSFPPYAGRSFDVSADGARFLMLTTAPEGQPDAPPAQVVVVLNWIEELQRIAEGPERW